MDYSSKALMMRMRAHFETWVATLQRKKITKKKRFTIICKK